MGKEASICGEMAGTPAGAMALIAMGYRRLSVLPSRAPVVRYLARKLTEDVLSDVRQCMESCAKESGIRATLNEIIRSLDETLVEAEM